MWFNLSGRNPFACGEQYVEAWLPNIDLQEWLNTPSIYNTKENKLEIKAGEFWQFCLVRLKSLARCIEKSLVDYGDIQKSKHTSLGMIF